MGIDNIKTVITITHDVTVKIIQAQIDHSIPEPAPERPLFSTIRQGNSTNALTKFNENKAETKIDIMGTATITQGDCTLTIPNYQKLTGLKTSTYQLLDAITIALTESGAKSPTVIIPLSNYMERRELKDRKTAKAQVKNDMEILRQASFTWEEKKGKNTEAYKFINLADSGEVKRNGDIVFTFGATFYNILLSYPIMPYPAQLQTINNRLNPNSYYLLRKIEEHKNMNVGKKNENIIAVKTLLEAAAFIPSYEEVMEGNKNVSARIIEPFERDLDALEPTLKWHYCHSKDTPLKEEELQNLSYDVFKTLLIHTDWIDYPDQTERLERKAKKNEAIKKRRTADKKNKENS
jgi:hypothetical protein